MASSRDFTSVILEKSVFVLLFLFPLVALSVKNGGSIVVTLLFLLGVMVAFREFGDTEIWERQLFLGFIVVFLVMVATLFVTEDLVTGLKRLERYFRWVAAIPVYLLIRKYSDRLRAISAGALLSSVIIAIQAFIQVHFKGHESASGAYSPIIFGEYATFCGFFLAIYPVYQDMGLRNRFLYTLGALLAFYAAAESGTRGAWIAIPIVSIYIFWQLSTKLNRKNFWIVAFSVVLVFAAALPASNMGKRFEKAVVEVMNYQPTSGDVSSTAQRLNMWRNSWEIFSDSPILGTGIGDFRVDTEKLIASGRTRSTLVFDHAHSIYFDTLAVSGLLGFFSVLLCLFIVPARIFWSEKTVATKPVFPKDFPTTAGIVLILSYMVFGLTEVWLIRNPAVNVYIVFMLVLLAEKRQQLKA